MDIRVHVETPGTISKSTGLEQKNAEPKYSKQQRILLSIIGGGEVICACKPLSEVLALVWT